jgi:single stranded DNA-binding protein
MIHDSEHHVTLVGKLGSAPEIKPTANGQMLILNLGIQVTSWATDDAGQRQPSERTSWHRVVSFVPRVVRCAQGLEKDDTIVVRGYLDQRRYQKDGQNLFITEFVAEELDPIRAKRPPSAIPSPPPAGARTEKGAEMLRITVELLPGGRESGARVISRGVLPITNLPGLVKAISGVGN